MRVLIVEDSPVVRDGIAKLIGQEAGVTDVGTACSLRDAERLLSALDFDLWILDFDLGDGTALELLERKQREAWPGTVAMLTKHGEEPIRRRCLEAGADCFFEKSRDLDRALDALRAFLAGGDLRGEAADTESVA